jgi:hypothetical protein
MFWKFLDQEVLDIKKKVLGTTLKVLFRKFKNIYFHKNQESDYTNIIFCDLKIPFKIGIDFF